MGRTQLLSRVVCPTLAKESQFGRPKSRDNTSMNCTRKSNRMEVNEKPVVYNGLLNLNAVSGKRGDVLLEEILRVLESLGLVGKKTDNAFKVMFEKKVGLEINRVAGNEGLCVVRIWEEDGGDGLVELITRTVFEKVRFWD